MQEILFKIRYFERGLSKSLKKIYFIFSFKSSLLQWTKLSKTKGVWSQWTVTLQVTKQVQKYSFICYILSDQVWWCDLKQFLRHSKNYISNFMQANWWHYKLFHSHLSFWIWELWKGREKITKILMSWERKELFRWNKEHFSYFLNGDHLEKKWKFDKK